MSPFTHPIDTDVRVHYQETGAGPRAFVLVHGGGCDATLWRNQVATLARHGRVLALDLPGHGRSDRPERVYDLPLFLDAVDAVVRQSKVSDAIVGGQSLGAMVAYEYARRHRDVTKGLIWVEGTFHIPRNVDEQVAAMQKRLEALRAPDYEKTVLAMWDSLFVPETPDAVRAEIRAKLLATPRHVLVSAMEHLMSPSMFQLERLDMPALAIFGAYWHPQAYEDAFREYLPRLEMHVIDGVGHFPMLEKPDAVNAIVEAFVDRNFTRPSI